MEDPGNTKFLSKLRRQGIDVPQPSPIMGNIPEIKLNKSLVQCSENSCNNWKDPPSLDCSSILFPYFKQWTKQYEHHVNDALTFVTGKTFSFRLGTVPVLYVTDPELVREINLCRSLDLGKPAYLQKDRGPLLGKGLITTNRAVWTHQRKTIAPNLYVDKDMLPVVIESAKALVKSWECMVESEGGVADIRVDEYLPTKNNREQWRLEKEIYSMIIHASKECNRGTTAEAMIQILMQGAKHGELGPSTPEQFVIDNCKDLYLAAFEVSGISAIWGLMLLASHPEWQERARAEQFWNDALDSHKLGKMKVLEMVVQEVLRLYPGVAFVSREALQDVKLGKLVVPKGVNIWIWLLELQQDPKLGGADADKFNPGRFANGVSEACKNSQAYIPFGVGARICPGQSLAILEMRVMFAVILANFSLSLSPNYRHIPNFSLLLEPKYGVNLLVRKI
ncbi:hypothetical protein RJ639_009155 [Escallonia herrerae]|uniref:Cytochrome P450 n=1 Tax=Escallonia herrerae TaxID=1293975 RepID=A0AA88VS82_9ASTE|nr:hypothetical protein RJ639_009155 [Escallonia herrerae]